MNVSRLRWTHVISYLTLVIFTVIASGIAYSAADRNSRVLEQGKDNDSLKEVRSTYNKSQVRGAIVFKNYCVVCHGESGDGKSRGAKLYGTSNLIIKPNSKFFYEQIVRLGGEATGKSPFMPIWEDELSEEQIIDVVKYLYVLRDPIQRGQAVFYTNCILCHGINGDGKGRASVLYNPPPSDLTRSDKNIEYKRRIVSLGGAAMGRSQVMPIWGEQLSEQEINDVVDYIEKIKVTQ
ncbi:MAG TPA: c-type cytochrome [Gammaproteobacteria bacterium]